MTPAQPVADFPVPGPGVFPSKWLDEAIARGIVSWDGPADPPSVQPASLDLRLGPVAYRLRCSFLPDVDHTVEERLEDLALGEIDLRKEGGILETNHPYLIPLAESLELPANIRAKANPKSSTGRIDVLTRVITNRGQRFDEIAPGYRGQLYLELVSSTFTIRLQPGLSLNQLRLASGRATVSDDELAAVHREQRLLYYHGAAVPAETLGRSDGFFLGLDLTGDRDGVVGYKAKRNSRLLDLSKIGAHEPADYWEEVITEAGDRLILEPGAFYLLLSAESVRIPPGFAGEMVAYDPTSGELRTHYAGFFDPGFGYDELGLPGSQAALEVRAHEVPFMIQHRQPVCKIALERLLEPSDHLYGEAIGSTYQGQQSTLSKYFKRPTALRQLSLPDPAVAATRRRRP